MKTETLYSARPLQGRSDIGPRLVDLCPEYRVAIEEFVAAAIAGDLDMASKHWSRAGRAARMFRARMSVSAGSA